VIVVARKPEVWELGKIIDDDFVFSDRAEEDPSCLDSMRKVSTFRAFF
jgi:hypothetical protein